MKKGPAWVERSLVSGPFVALCTDEAQFAAAWKHLKAPATARPPWVSPGSHATTHTLENPHGELCCLVCLAPPGEAFVPIQVAALLVHEAVHVWQHWCEANGEKEPSAEFEAYAIQSISQRLMVAYAGRHA